MSYLSPTTTLSLVAAVTLSLGCSSGGDDIGNSPGVDGAPGELDIDGSVDATAQPTLLPTWTLEDIQPASARFGQTYGLDVYTDKIVVVVLLEGF